MKPAQLIHPDPEPDHLFAALHGVQRHLAPGQLARLLAVDFFTPNLDEPVWVAVLSCGEHH